MCSHLAQILHVLSDLSVLYHSFLVKSHILENAVRSEASSLGFVPEFMQNRCKGRLGGWLKSLRSFNWQAYACKAAGDIYLSIKRFWVILCLSIL